MIDYLRPSQSLMAKITTMGNSQSAYSRGQAKSPNKNGSLVMPEKMPGKRSDTLREAPG
jgi:hypothetical protein